MGKDKKEKKEKKHKKHKKERSSDDDQIVFDDAPVKQYGAMLSRNARAPTNSERDSWMTAEPAGLFDDKMAPQQPKEPEGPATLSSCPSREANPWAAIPGGDGLPKEYAPDHEPDDLSGDEAGPSAPRSAAPTKRKIRIVGDGGASWRARQLHRVREKAKRDGTNVEELAHEHFGSVSQMKREISEKRHKSGGRMGRMPVKNPGMRKPRENADGRGYARTGVKFDPRTGTTRAPEDKDKPEVDDGTTKFEHLGDRGHKNKIDKGSLDRHGRKKKDDKRDKREDKRDKREHKREREPSAAAAGPANKPGSTNKFGDDGSFMDRFNDKQRAEPAHRAPSTQQRASAAPAATPGADPNKLAAEALRARIGGDMAKYKSLMAQVEQLRTGKAAGGGGGGRGAVSSLKAGGGGGSAAARSSGNPREKVVVMQELDASGRPREFAQAEKVRILPGNGRRAAGPETKLTKGMDGRRERYFADDDVSLEELVARERKEGRQAKYDSMYAKNIMKDKRLKEKKGHDGDSDEEYGAGSTMHEKFEAKRSTKHADKDWQRQQDRAIAEDKRLAKQITNVLESPVTAKHLIISLGEHAFLALPKRGSLTPGHCLILPLESSPSSVACNEDVAAELLRFKRCLSTMFRKAIGKSCLFLETVSPMDLKHNRHFTIECIPCSNDIMQQAPGYYKKALLECDVEWSQHESKRCIDTKQNPIRRSVPEHFPYFHVEFSPQGGYAHVIEDGNMFSNQLGKEVLVGMMEIDATVLAKPQGYPMDKDRKRVQGFIKSWTPYDWTRELEGGEY